jgi:DNA-binding PadR family transcriptional regulator
MHLPPGFLPLAPATLHILLALAPGELHGYAIMQEVLRQSGGHYKIGPGTLYDNLQRLLDQELVEERTSPTRNQDPRRRYYALTPQGQGVLQNEIARLDRVVRAGKSVIRNWKPLPQEES